jgi:hypothetical protein
MIWRHASGPALCGLFMPSQHADPQQKKKDVVYVPDTPISQISQGLPDAWKRRNPAPSE